ncbi:hypothetical protein MMC16_001572 [Acarospora aff. strigata]|nr:hypothetical protein [Acarospora aff. strigata]
MEETFLQLPLHLDPTSKSIQAPTSTHDKALLTELHTLNQLHRSLLTLDGAVPPPPLPVNPKRTAQLTKMREQGNVAFRKGNHAEAVKLYSYGVDMALSRPVWEPATLMRDEVAAMYANRAQAYMGMQQWPEGMVDAETSVRMSASGNAKAWWRKGRCLVEMGRVAEAREWVGKALEHEGNDGDLVGLMKEVDGLIARKEGRGLAR